MPATSRQLKPAPQKVESRALAKGLELLNVLSAAESPVPLGELASAIGLGKPSTLRLLHTLLITGFVERDEVGSYFVQSNVAGPAWINRLVQAARPEMERLNGDLAETITLAVLRDDHIRVACTIESPQHIRMSNYQNRILPPYASSLGKAISAWQTPERLQLLVQVYGIYRTTDRTITEPVLIREEMARIRERGFACEYEETVLGGCCFAVPVQLEHEPVRAAISVSMPVARLTPEREELIPDLLVKSAIRVAKKLERISH